MNVVIDMNANRHEEDSALRYQLITADSVDENIVEREDADNCENAKQQVIQDIEGHVSACKLALDH
jgi:hypothetical protein